jgi:hypothetical protein
MSGIVFSGPGFAPEVVAVDPLPVVVPDAAPEAAVEPVEVVAEVEAVEPAKPVKRRRARHPAGAEPERPGTFIGNDPATEVNEAWVEE